MCSDQIGVLCTHRRHVREFNHAALLRQFQDNPTAIVPLTIGTSAARVENLRPWLTKEGFHELTHVAVGARVILNANINMEKGEVVNGWIWLATTREKHMFHIAVHV